MSKKLLPEDTIIRTVVGNENGIPIGEYRKFLYEAISKDFIDSMDYSSFQKWLFSHTGKTLKEVVSEFNNHYEVRNMNDLLSERRFNIISKQDKAFIIAFNEAMIAFGYDCENIISSGLVWGLFMIIYGKTDTKSRPCIARIYIKEDGTVNLRLFLTKIDKHMRFIENAPKHIKVSFNFIGGDCTFCNANCKSRKCYSIDGQSMEKCVYSTFYFNNLSIDKLDDYMNLLKEFHPIKK